MNPSSSTSGGTMLNGSGSRARRELARRAELRDARHVADGSVHEKYEGQMAQGRMHGTGTYLYSDGSTYDGDWAEVVKHIRVRRLLISEEDRIGIGTFQPKDEKNQDSTELTGDINYRRIAEYGSDTDPRAFNFDGEFNVANRGIIEFVEILKLDVAFLYDLLGATQEQKVKPQKFAQTDIDEVILGHTNEPEFRKLQSNELMEAFRDRTIRIDVPYNLEVSSEASIHRRRRSCMGGLVPRFGGLFARSSRGTTTADLGDGPRRWGEPYVGPYRVCVSFQLQRVSVAGGACGSKTSFERQSKL